MPEKKFQASEMSADAFQKLMANRESTRQLSGKPESLMQRRCVKWFRGFAGFPALGKLLFAIPNGGERSDAEASIMAGEGVTPGVPDLCLAVARGGWYGLYMELKILPNQPTDPQREMLEKLYQQGYMTQVVYTYEQFVSLVTTYLNLPIVPTSPINF